MAKKRAPRNDGQTRVIGYVRVSTDKQADSGAGLESQRRTIEAECARRGWQLADMITDDGCSAKNLNRPGFQKAIASLADGQAEALMVAKLDRLSRSVADVCQVGDMAAHHGFDLVILDSPIDTSSPYGRAQLNMMATFAQLERELIGLRTKEALAVKKSQGVQLGRRVDMSKDVEQTILKMRRDGATMTAIAEHLNNQGVKTARGGTQWYQSTVSKVLARVAA